MPRKNTIHLTPHTHYAANSNVDHPYSGGTGLDDPRTSSLQSLRPVESAGPNRRKLLLIYIHGFMGTETSFKSFPAHVHNLLSMTLSESHVVHTKIYPRYQSRKNISYARDAFSNWLTPHESDSTDIILLGHSLGGILAAEVALLPSHRPGSNDLFQHKILGHIAYDTPFLGMHPGVVTTGIASLFRPAPATAQSLTSDQSSSSAPLSFNPFQSEPVDSNYNPAYSNDVNLPIRKSKLDQAFYFLTKHYGDLNKAATSYVKSHLEFGGCLADYDGLKKRYNSFRPLEDVDELAGKRTTSGKIIPRVRFVNYYTASTGRIKQQPPPSENKTLVAETEMTNLGVTGDGGQSPARPSLSTPRISVEEHTRDRIISKDISELDLADHEQLDDFGEDVELEMQHIDPVAEPPSPTLGEKGIPEEYSVEDGSGFESVSPTGSFQPSVASAETLSTISSTKTSDIQLPPLPSPPLAPEPFDPTPYTTADPSTLKLAQKEHERLMKSYDRAKRDHEKTVRDREKHLAKLEKARQKEIEKGAAGLSKHEQQEQARLKKEAERMAKEKERLEQGTQNEQIKREATLNQEAYDAALARQVEKDARAQQKSSVKPEKAPKKQRDRKFCTLPAKDSRTGQRDPTWVRVYMENMDEVVAHTSLFFVSETYAKLVGDTADRIEKWLTEADTIRAVKKAQEWELAADKM